jgi:8-oxo-dGTP pyrophosphatase MutT (NUDIX family)
MMALTHERAPGSISASLLLTQGTSNRLFLTRHGVLQGEPPTWGLIAGGVELGENGWDAVLREAREEANIEPSNIIFARGRNDTRPHVAVLNTPDKVRVGLVYDVTYSGPQIPGFYKNISGDKSVDRIELFSWQQILRLLETPEHIYRAEFNHPQLIRWLLMDYGGNPKRTNIINNWIYEHPTTIPGRLTRISTNSERLFDQWEYIPPYDSWLASPSIHGRPEQTNYARRRSVWQQGKKRM